MLVNRYLLELLLQAEPLRLRQPQCVWLWVGCVCVCLLAEPLPPQERQLLLHRSQLSDWSTMLLLLLRSHVCVVTLLLSILLFLTAFILHFLSSKVLF